LKKLDEEGVLIHGKEPYCFDRSFFETDANDVSKYIKEYLKKRIILK